MALAFSKPKYIHNTVIAYEKHGKGEKTIVFNVNIEHSIQVTAAFVEAGYNARHLDSTMSDRERTDIMSWFAKTPDAILNNVGIATTGFDQPDIINVIVNKSVMSLILWLQMCGRGGRITETKSMFNVIDMGNNWSTHGEWHQPRDWYDIFYNPPKPGKGEGIAPVKDCPNCEAIVPASATKCKFCGWEFEEKEQPVEVRINDFVVITKDIDVEKLIAENQDKKEYFTFFKIGNDLAKSAKKTIPVMTDEYATFILQKYYELGKVWAKECSDRRKEKKLRFNDWHKNQAMHHLFFELKTHFPEWKTNEETYIKYLPGVTPTQVRQDIEVKVIQNGHTARIPISEMLGFARAQHRNFNSDFYFEI